MSRFYEWKKHGPKKQPYYVHFKDGQPLLFAALYDKWKDEEGTWIPQPFGIEAMVSALVTSHLPLIQGLKCTHSPSLRQDAPSRLSGSMVSWIFVVEFVSTQLLCQFQLPQI